MKRNIYSTNSLHDMSIVTDRLELISGTLPLIRAELHDRNRFAAQLQAEVPATWPPPLNDRDSMEWCERYLQKHADGVGWAHWYFVRRENGNASRIVIGTGGFGGKPDARQTVEVGYSIIEEFQGLGYATEATAGLIRWAFSHLEVERVIAETYPSLQKSIRVLEKNGFAFVGGGSKPPAIRYERRRGHGSHGLRGQKAD